MMPWVIASCALVAIGAIAIGLSYTPLVAARSLSVRGERHLTEGQILRIARLGEGTNLIHADSPEPRRASSGTPGSRTPPSSATCRTRCGSR